MFKYYVKSNTPSIFQQSTNSVIDRIMIRVCLIRLDRRHTTTTGPTFEKDDDARGCSSGDATRDDERDGGGGTTDDECDDECGVAKVLRGTCD